MRAAALLACACLASTAIAQVSSEGDQGAFHPYKAQRSARAAPIAHAEHKPALDLNAPIDTRPTIASEISRGNKAAFDCSLKYVHTLSFAQCVSDAVSADEQKQPNSVPFIIGAFFGECHSDDISVKTLAELAPTNSIAEAELPDAQRDLAMSYGVFRHYQQKLGITDEQLVAALGDVSTAGTLAQLHLWEQQPPKAPPGSQ